jgi:PAS domain S-box-containing protein
MKNSGESFTSMHAAAERGGGQSQFEQLFALAPEALLVSDAQGRLLKWNVAAAVMFGHDEQAMAALCIEVFLPLPDRSAHVQHRAACMASPTVRVMSPNSTFKAQRRDGTSFDAEVSLGPIELDGQPRVIAIMGLTQLMQLGHATPEQRDRLGLVMSAAKPLSIEALTAVLTRWLSARSY